MNILIVDDNNNNRMILRYLLEDYVENHPHISFDMDEACDGIEAVSKCKENAYDIVFMDIMMPTMDGIQATKLIREHDKKVMIIAVSAVDDIESKKSILNNGAEDYISKPINADVFVSRMDNYIILVETRKHSKKNRNKKNLFSDKIYKRHTKFIIDSEDSLSEFWEFFLLSVRDKCDNLSDIVRTIVSIADVQLRSSISSGVYIEESDEAQYFTLTDVGEIPMIHIEGILKKNNPHGRYMIDDSKISFEILKKSANIYDDSVVSVQAVEVVQTPSKAVVAEEITAPSFVLQQSQHLQVFDYMDEDDLHDLEEYAGKLNSLMLVVGNGDITEDEIIDIYTYLDRMSGILATYSDVFVISKALTSLSNSLEAHMPEFMNNSEALAPMCKAFSRDMSNWIEMSFHTGAPSVEFMNDTIVVNCQTIESMLTMNDANAGSEEDFDDIFDF